MVVPRTLGEIPIVTLHDEHYGMQTICVLRRMESKLGTKS